MKADFAIGITTRDRWSELGRTLDQLARYGLTDRETLVIDDGSITPVPPDLRARHPWVRFERSDTSCGYIAQRNDLAQRLTAPFYLSLDDDSYPVGGDLAVAAQWLAAHREVIALAFCVTESAAVPPVTDSGKPFPVRYYIGCAHLLRREDFLRLGGYREELESYCEEFEFSLRAWNEGATVMAWPAVTFRHERSMAGRDLDRINRLLTRNDLWIAVWHYPWLFFALSFLNCLPRQFRVAHHRTHWRAVARGLLSAICTFSQAARLRGTPSWSRHRAWRRLPCPETGSVGG